jgi:glycine cleavage system H protein
VSGAQPSGAAGQGGPGETVSYRRARFSTRLPVGRLYTPSHYWLLEVEEGLFQVGFTRFATRMLGDLVEYGFQVKGEEEVRAGQAIGWVEGFKALTEVYCAVEGRFIGGNPGLEKDVTLLDSDPYGSGWLYRARGTPDSNSVDMQGYMRILDATIDRMLMKQGEGGDG